MSEIRIQTEDFDPGTEIAALNDMSGSIGAIASFVGLVRGDDGLIAMTLDHYPGMCEREIAAHVSDARKRWPIAGLRIVHRVGRLTPGERIVFVAVASAHRQAAFHAAEFLMDYLKTRAPFWKREERASGETWVESRAQDDESVKRWQ
ncbi:MAG TPA: molybdenum cofactor biosynthesis protein MoaE [Micropepsaceae bacterium]|jgi:molybdopterin synthase catalytic subunit|nr:molybdenum cofactor biosynthesis protein MoaE [Micropepsaceae bacterium]